MFVYNVTVKLIKLEHEIDHETK